MRRRPAPRAAGPRHPHIRAGGEHSWN
jgi:hypothetical protein